MSEDLLSRLQGAQSETEREWLVMLFSLERLSESVQEAVWAAAIPHWFDSEFLSALLEQPGFGESQDYQKLIDLSFVEVYPERGYNVHERTRALLLERLWNSKVEHYRELSRRAANYSAKQNPEDDLWRVETIYHALLAGLKGSVEIFASQGIEWHNRFEYEKIEILIRLVLEAVEAGRLTGEAAGWAYYRQGRLDIQYNRYSQAQAELEKGLKQEITDQELRANTLQAIGDVQSFRKEMEAALGSYTQALELYRAVGARLGEANTLKAIGDVQSFRKEMEAALGSYTQALELYRAVGARLGEANTLRAIGEVEFPGKQEQALENYTIALEIYQSIGDSQGEAETLEAFGNARQYLGEQDLANRLYDQALEIFRTIQDRQGEAKVWKAMGDLTRKDGEVEVAREYYQQALEIFRAIKDPRGEDEVLIALDKL
jgi:tetratricopeptide (TPR) repeat protein